jgi:peroxiredoxin
LFVKKNVAILAFAVVVIAAMLYIGSNMARKRQAEARRTGSLAPGQVIGRVAPDFSLKTLDGKTLTLSDLRGKAVVLNFWATWCPPCKVELPWFVDLQKQYGPQGLQVVGISEDEGGKDKVAAFVKEMGVNYTIAVDDNSVSEKYGDVEDLPTTFYIDRNGKIVQFAMGLVDRDEIEQKMKAALAAKTSAGD